MIAAKDPKEIIDALEQDARLQLKGDGPITYHLACDYSCDADSTLYCRPRHYIKKMITANESMFSEKPHPYSSPFEHNDQPELDDSGILEAKVTTMYHSMVSALQWLISLGRFDVLMAVMTMARF